MDALLAPCDALRAALYRWLAPRWAWLLVDRSRRVAWLGAASVLMAFALTVTLPLWLLALGPLLLGVPHLLADLRYLVVLPGLLQRRRLCAAAALPLLATGLGAPAVVGLLAVAVVVAGARAAPRERLLAAAAWVALSAVALVDEGAFVLGFVHAHNLLALVLWWNLRPRDACAGVVPLLAAAGVVLLAGGAFDTLTWIHASDAVLPGLDEHAQAYAPGATGPWAARVVLCFAFLQAVHYAVWLRLVPDDARARPVPRSFRASWQALRADLGRPLVLLALLLAVGIAAWGVFDLIAARAGYLRLAAFHGYLELAVATLWWLERRGAR
ncbi:MAG: hypothetical protein U1F56_02555 [Rubrivivax sp.]